MRSMLSILSRLVVAGMLVSISAAAVFGQDPTMALKSEWSAVSKGRTEFEVSDAALLPSTLALAAEQSGCSYKDDIKNAPVRFMRPEGHRLAIVFCSGIIGSHQIFDVSNVLRPRLLELPFLVQPEGVGTTARPGWITWEKEANVFQAETGSDMLPSPRVRHTYRYSKFNVTFALVRVEVQHDGVGEWITMWDAPRWSLPAKPK
jgi:hypothetical protein